MTDEDDARNYPKYYPADIEFAIALTRDRIEEWDNAEDPHGYCFERPAMVALLAEIGHLRAMKEVIVDEVESYSGRNYADNTYSQGRLDLARDALGVTG